MVSIGKYIGVHKGEKALVCGCGPSITQFDLKWYKHWDGPTYGANKIWYWFEPTYYFSIYSLGNRFLDNKKNSIVDFDWCDPVRKVCEDKTKLCMSTIGLTLICAAYRMGCSEINLIGIDFTVSECGEIYFYSRPSSAKHYMRPKERTGRGNGTGFRDVEGEHIHNINRAIAKIRESGVVVNNLSEISRVTR